MTYKVNYIYYTQEPLCYVIYIFTLSKSFKLKMKSKAILIEAKYFIFYR